MKYFDCLPIEYHGLFERLLDVREIRIRNNRPIKVNVAGKWYFVGDGKLVQNISQASAVGEVCKDIVQTACNGSIYAYEKMLAQGYFTLSDGVRFGVCGSVNGAKIFSEYSSLCLRVPHCVNCIDDGLLKSLEGKNVAVVGPPGSGKTTFLRDLACKLSKSYNVLIADERGELFYDDECLNKVCCDTLKWCDKEYAFEVAIRSMSPDYIVCDELAAKDISAVENCVNSGVMLACSIHGNSADDAIKKMRCNDCFDVFVLLKNNSVVSLTTRKTS